MKILNIVVNTDPASKRIGELHLDDESAELLVEHNDKGYDLRLHVLPGNESVVILAYAKPEEAIRIIRGN